MIISHKHQFVFVHVQKCAGTSIGLTLLPWLGTDDVVLGYTPQGEALSAQGQRAAGLWKHAKARDARRLLGDDLWREYFTFAFVRNPWDVAVSDYHWWRTTTYENQYGTGQAIKRMKDFDEYVRSRYFQRRPAAPFVSDEEGRIVLDYVGRYETLQQDFDAVMEAIGLPRTELPTQNATEHSHFSTYYTPITRELVGQAYAEDLEAFGYAFPDPQPAVLAAPR
jgi:hypothetical protein